MISHVIFISYMALPYAHAHSTGLAPVPLLSCRRNISFPANSCSLERQQFHIPRFHVAVRLLSNGSQMTSKCGKSISDKLGYRLVFHFFVLTTL